jgi:hypothetical protein
MHTPPSRAGPPSARRSSRCGEHAAQIATLYDHLTREDYRNPESAVLFVPYGGMVNTVAPDATATAQRDSIMKVVYTASWGAAGEDAANLAWVRRVYQAVYVDTGGVPVPNDVNDGSYINYPDVNALSIEPAD